MSPKWHPNSIRIGNPFTGSERQVANRRHVGSNWGAPGSEKVWSISLFWVSGFVDFCLLWHPFLEAIYNSCIKAGHDLESLLVTTLHIFVWRFSNFHFFWHQYNVLARFSCFNVSAFSIHLSWFYMFPLFLTCFGMHVWLVSGFFWEPFGARGSPKDHQQSVWNFTSKQVIPKS